MGETDKTKKSGTGRRGFLKTVVAGGVAAQAESVAQEMAQKQAPLSAADSQPSAIAYPRTFSGRGLQTLSFPLGGIGSGSIGLGGRGQLRDWQIFNRADKGHSPTFAFPSVFAQNGSRKTYARVLESRIQPPFEGESGLGSDNVPGLPRLESSVFHGGFPIAAVEFHDSGLPVRLALEAFTPLIPHDADESGLPIAVLRYRAVNPQRTSAKVSIAWSIENPVGKEGRACEYRTGAGLSGLFFSNPFLAAIDPLAGSLALSVLDAGDGRITYLRWPQERWWTPALLFWDDFSADGELGPESPQRGTTASLCLSRTIPAGGEGVYTFLLSWRFPNRTPDRCGWQAVKGEEKTAVGNHYCARFANAWQAAEYAAAHLPDLERRTRHFVAVMRESTLPGPVVDAAMSNLSTLVSPTCFRTEEGSFHGFEGYNNQGGCCFGTCNHVWNYEVATAFVFPSLSRSMRESAFGFRTNEHGRMDMRELLPFGKENWPYAAADGQMGQIMKLYLDWRLSGDTEWLRRHWPGAKRALEFAWIPGGWDENRDGVMEGAQHNTYDVEFYGPNPLCGVWYLGALRAAEEMARAAGDSESADTYHKLFAGGSQWIDENLFNGEYYAQKIEGRPKDRIADGLQAGMGTVSPEQPTYQLGDGCLIDQLLGQYMADIAGLPALLEEKNIRKTMASILKYNRKRSLAQHASVQRTYALNDETGIVVCDYGRGERPKIPFPYFAELWTGLEYVAAALLMNHGFVREGVQAIGDVRRRYDGERRNPWDEPECGHHYARAMSSWAAIPALSGFSYDGVERALAVAPKLNPEKFSSFWSTGTGWGSFSQEKPGTVARLRLNVSAGELRLRSVALASAGKPAGSEVMLSDKPLAHRIQRERGRARVMLDAELRLAAGEQLTIQLNA